jgi:hypothetical protein
MKPHLQKIFFLCCISAFFVSCHTQTETTTTPPTSFHGIPPQGIGGDSLLNIQKNRWVASPNFADVSLSDIINLPHDVLSGVGSEERYKWSSAASAQAAGSESKGVRFTGYLINVREEGNESCNGNDSNYHDFHLWIADSSGKNESGSIVAEATPFWKEQFPGWLLTKFENLKSQNIQVRVSGWIMWDEDHPTDIGSSRASLWEVHPMTKFEYLSKGTWETLQ